MTERRGERQPGRPQEHALAVWFLRAVHGWTQAQLAQASGVHQTRISLYEAGQHTPSRDTLARLAGGARFPLPVLDRLVEVFRSALSAVPLDRPAPPLELDREAAGAVARSVQASILVGQAGLASAAPSSPEWAAAQRALAPERWRRLESFDPEDRRFLIELAVEYRSFALCELVCERSVEVAPRSGARALALAELALFVAERAEEGEAWRARIQGYAWAFVGNARRVAQNLAGAEEAFRRSRALWEAGAAADPGILDPSRVLDLEASFLRARRRFTEALALLDQADRLSPSAERTASILLNRSALCEQMGDCQGSVAALRQAAPLIEAGSESRQLWLLRFNLGVNLCHLGRHTEAMPLAAEARELAVRLRNESDLQLVLWLEARIAAGLGRRDEALAALRQVRDDFAARGLAYDAALATLDLAALLLEEGEHAEVRALAGGVVATFESLEVYREALAAVRLFYTAVERETATAELGRRLVRFLERARHDPELRFERGSARKPPAPRSRRR